jgi:hypothetical protein
VLFVMAAMILWMGIGSAGFTRRTETSARNTLDLMQRPQAYNAGSAMPALPVAPQPAQAASEAGVR